jgi:hypothetical protein
MCNSKQQGLKLLLDLAVIYSAMDFPAYTNVGYVAQLRHTELLLFVAK